MKLIRGLANPCPGTDQGSVVTLGNFDGVHLGHQTLLSQAGDLAQANGLPLVAVTFEPLPREYFAPQAPVARLTRLRERFCFIANLGTVDTLVVLPFRAQLVAMSAEDFVREILVDRLNARHVVIGDDFRFGKGRAGDFAMLQRMGEELGFVAEAAGTVALDGERVSSTRIRHHLDTGDVAGAARLLGRPMTLCGRVTHGDKRGRQIGFPTANIGLNRRLSPLSGVYVVTAVFADGRRVDGVANVGTRPTVDGQDARLEVHLFDFDADIYGDILQVEFRHFLRGERKFGSLDELIDQIGRDAEAARSWLARDVGAKTAD